MFACDSTLKTDKDPFSKPITYLKLDHTNFKKKKKNITKAITIIYSKYEINVSLTCVVMHNRTFCFVTASFLTRRTKQVNVVSDSVLVKAQRNAHIITKNPDAFRQQF